MDDKMTSADIQHPSLTSRPWTLDSIFFDMTKIFYTKREHTYWGISVALPFAKKDKCAHNQDLILFWIPASATRPGSRWCLADSTLSSHLPPPSQGWPWDSVLTMGGRGSWLSRACGHIILPLCLYPFVLLPAWSTDVMAGGTGAILQPWGQKPQDGWRSKTLVLHALSEHMQWPQLSSL